MQIVWYSEISALSLAAPSDKSRRKSTEALKRLGQVDYPAFPQDTTLVNEVELLRHTLTELVIVDGVWMLLSFEPC